MNEFVKCTIVDMTKKVIDQIARKYEEIRKGLGDVMGGKVLEYEAKIILEQGVEQGLEQGLEQKGIKVFKNAIHRGVSVEDAQAIAEISDELVEQILREM